MQATVMNIKRTKCTKDDDNDRDGGKDSLLSSWVSWNIIRWCLRDSDILALVSSGLWRCVVFDEYDLVSQSNHEPFLNGHCIKAEFNRKFIDMSSTIEVGTYVTGQSNEHDAPERAIALCANSMMLFRVRDGKYQDCGSRTRAVVIFQVIWVGDRLECLVEIPKHLVAANTSSQYKYQAA
ncbi:hypothetical protein K474DRAFT_1107376 [Panus rudis PR-1116 ss-1]|nr:hypothetical protein K474DRAFT_1107376 [Panus rudis PR-1116 ss-1]